MVADRAIPSEETAASELALYLQKATGARFPIVREYDPRPEGPAFFIGPTVAARLRGVDAARMGGEEWTIRSSGGQIVLAGGRPRGTLYAVYHFLEDELAIRWWNPFEESVPPHRTLRIGRVTKRGQPAFAQRDISGADGTADFLARNRVNGAHTGISWSFGGYEGFASPWFVHSSYDVVPPKEYFDTHPEYFAERAGFRTASRMQLCVTNPDLPALVAARLSPYAAAAEAAAAATGAPVARLLDFSQNDWGGRCQCDKCQAEARRLGSDAGPLLVLLNDVAGRLSPRHPEMLLTTLAYTFTMTPPTNIRADDRVVVRLAGYGVRDFSRGITAPENTVFRNAVEGWSRVAARLWIWDYAVVFFERRDSDRNLPMPSYRSYAEDFRFYRDHGVGGIFVQHEFPIASDLRDLKLWLYLKLMENPDLDEDALIREFTGRYYGAAARPMRDYLRTLESAADAKPGHIGADADPEAFRYVDADFVVRAGKIFDRAEASVAEDPERLRRVRHARLTLDWATLRLRPAAVDLEAVADRYRATWYEQIDLRADAEAKSDLREDVDDEISDFLSGR